MDRSKIGLVILTAALFLVALGLPLVLKLVPRNKRYGLRTPTTLASEEVWFDVNRTLGACMSGSGLVVGGLTLAWMMGAPIPLFVALFAAGLSGPLSIVVAAKKVKRIEESGRK